MGRYASETQFLRLTKPAALGDRINGWRVCWFGAWDKCRVFFIVMVERPQPAYPIESRRPASSPRGVNCGLLRTHLLLQRRPERLIDGQHRHCVCRRGAGYSSSTPSVLSGLTK